MLVLTGNNLGERQKELNIKVNEAASENANFENLKAQPENSDVDRLFKIDLASKYKNVEYILEVLKCGDSLYISRALKCIWLYADEYSNIINPDYLNHNIFPFMSMKMKRKFLSTISMYIKNERAISFYKYCMITKLINLAFRFLIFTPELFKLQKINEQETLSMIRRREGGYVQHFIGNSFILAESYLNTLSKMETNQTLHELRYLYSISDLNYLELLEKYYTIEDGNDSIKLGLRISKDIMKKYKERMRKNPVLYFNLVNKTMLVKHSTSVDAKFYAVVFMPSECSTFWNRNFYGTYKYILDLIPFEERLKFLKNIFTEHYPGEEFEMSLHFYKLKYYTLMTTEERETWALRHIENGLELLGSGKDFTWYKFVNFDVALGAIKKYIMVTINADARAEMVTILVNSAKNDQELEKLFNYYYERHINENQHHKERFIDTVLDVHNVFHFDESCWTAFNKLFYSLEVYNNIGYYGSKIEYRMISLIYNIIHGKDVPDVLKSFIDSGIYYYLFKAQTNKLSKEKEEVVYQFMLNFYLEKIDKFNSQIYNKDLTKRVRKYVHFVLDLMFQYSKPKEEIPEIAEKYMLLDWDEFKNHLLFQRNVPELTQELLLRLLKENSSLVVSKLPEIKEKLETHHYSFKLTILLRKLKVYFANDVAKDYLELFKEIVSRSELSFTNAVYGIFQLADNNFKIEFMTKHVPTEPKIDHSTIDRKLLSIQEAICRVAYYSRPPVPLSNMLMYIKGDYVHYCMPMFNSYLANLPLPLCIEFTKSLIDAPLSVQKHGLRLAFQCFSTEDLTKLLLDVWKKTKNVSLRMVIYKYLFTKILNEDERTQKALYIVLKALTFDLHEDDDEELFNLITSNKLPYSFIGDHLETVWKIINKFSDKQVYIERKKNVVNSIDSKMCLVPKDFLETFIDDHLKFALDKEQFPLSGIDSNNPLVGAKWQLIAKYLVYYTSKEESEKKLALTQFIIDKCMKMWNMVYEGTFVARKFCFQFLKELVNNSFYCDEQTMSQGNLILEKILKELEDTLPVHEMYETIWELRLSIISRKIIIAGKPKIGLDSDGEKLKVIQESVIEFGKQFSNLLSLFIDKRTYYASFFEAIMSMLEQYSSRLLQHLNSYECCNFSETDAHVLICAEIFELNIFVSYMFALKILPNKYPDSGSYFDKYKAVINKIKLFDNEEIQCYLYQKFVIADDFKHKEFLQFRTVTK